MTPALPRRVYPVVVALVLLVAAAACDDPFPQATPNPWPTATTWTWQWQLTGEIDLTVDATVFDLDVFTTSADAVQRLRSRGRHLICYVNAGTYEDARPDAGRFPAAVLGAGTGSPGERWLDIRQWSVLKPILADRLRLCRSKGFVAVDADNVDGYTHLSGFPLTFDDQLTFNRKIAALARSMGLSPGLHNDVDQVVALEPDFDFAVNEECFIRGECERLAPFVESDKPVFHVEYDTPTVDFCQVTLGLGFASVRKERALGAWLAPCLP